MGESQGKQAVHRPLRRVSGTAEETDLVLGTAIWRDSVRIQRLLIRDIWLTSTNRYYEWLTKSPKTKLPHFLKHKNNHLMYFAGLWDCVHLPSTYFPTSSPCLVRARRLSIA